MKNLFILFICIISLPLYSQNKTGIGKVTDINGFVIPNATIHISPNEDASVIFEYVCDKNGYYIFDFISNYNDFTVNVFPTNQTLQFRHNQESIVLSNSNNMLSHNVELLTNNGIMFTVIDLLGNPVSNAEIMMYDSKNKWKIDSNKISKTVYTDINGQIEIKSLAPIAYWFNIKKDYATNRFTVNNTNTNIDTTVTTNITITIRDLTQMELYMCGSCDNKTWQTDSMILFGSTMMYDADTKLLSDATWWDSNGRQGYWWFNATETIMYYDYSNSSMGIIEATNLTITDSTWVGDMEFTGMNVIYYMSVPQLDIVDLSLSVQDFTIYLNVDENTNIKPEDLAINSSHCFTCNIALSKTYFDISDLGEQEIYATLEDRCGNLAVDTFVITVIDKKSVSVGNLDNLTTKIYPNPTKDILFVEYENININKIELCTVKGEILSQIHIKEIRNNKLSFKTAHLNKGLYLIKIYSIKSVAVKKIIIE